MKDAFHVHTYRCGHASNETEEDYIKKAINIGATTITFTDHAPFPGDPFFDRMKFNELNEYVNLLHKLREEYKKEIRVRVGLEIEYLPTYIDYYKSLKKSNMFDVLMIGQHFYAIESKKYSFLLSEKELSESEFIECGKSIVEGIETGLFDVVAHPDRIFRRRNRWDEDMKQVALQIIEAAEKHHVLLEQNESSKRHDNQYWIEFWELVPQKLIIQGVDAHATSMML